MNAWRSSLLMFFLTQESHFDIATSLSLECRPTVQPAAATLTPGGSEHGPLNENRGYLY